MTTGLIERLEADCTGWKEADKQRTEAAQALRSLQAEVERLRGALEPFAKAADKLDGLWSEDDWRWNDSVRSNVTVLDLRRARDALTGSGEG